MGLATWLAAPAAHSFVTRIAGKLLGGSKLD
jgi:hypothetical protein